MLNQAFVWVIFVLSTVAGLYLFYKAAGGYKRITISITFLAFYLVFIYIGSPILFIREGMTNIRYFIAANAGIILIPIGMLIANELFKFSPRIEIEVYNKIDIVTNIQNRVKVVWLITVIIGVIVCWTYVSKLDPIPLFYGFTNTGESSQIAVLRQQSTKEFANYELYQDMMNLILPFLIAMLFIRYQQTKNKTMLILFILLSSLNIFALIATTEKAPAMFFILTMLVVYFIAQKGIRVKGIIIALILIIGINYLITFMKIAPNSEWVDSSSSSTDIDVPSESGPIDWPISSIKDKISRASQGLLERLIMGQTSGLYYYFEIFPQTHGFLKGMSIPNPLGLPYEYVNTSQYVYKIVYPDSPLNGTIPTVFFGDVYANFGYIVMLLSMVVVGFVMQLADIYFVRAIKTIVNTSFYSVLFLLFGKLGITTFFSAVFNTGTIALALLYLVLKYLNNEKVEIRNLWGRPSVMREVEPS